MMISRIVRSLSIFLLVLLLGSGSLHSQAPKYEVRAVWISTASGDWPSSLDPAEQRRSLIAMIDLLHRNNFNTVYFQVRPRGNTFYASSIEPWSAQLTGVLGKDPGWDPLDVAIAEAHKRGMELHAWFNVAKVWGAADPPESGDHLLVRHRDWVRQADGEWWIDMGNPDARAYTERLVLELVREYDLDGVQFDFIRYPSGMFDDRRSYAKWGNGEDRATWRRGNITDFVRSCYREITPLKPWCKVGSAPLGIYLPIDGASSGFAGYTAVFQDSRAWLREVITDYLVPQIYWSIGEQQDPYDPDFTTLCRDWAKENYGRQTAAGIGIYRENVSPEIQEQVLISRASRMQGQAFFRFEHLLPELGSLGDVYASPALVPPMYWKDSIPPLPPVNVSIVPDANSVPRIQWAEPAPAKDGERPFWYVVYRSETEPVDTRNAENIAAVLPATEHSYLDDQAVAGGGKLFHTVTSLDRCGNESGTLPPPTASAGVMTRFAQPGASPALSANYPEPFREKTYITYSLPVKSHVTLTLRHLGTLKDTVIVDAQKNPGLHVVRIDASKFPAGRIEYQLMANDEMIRKVMEKE